MPNIPISIMGRTANAPLGAAIVSNNSDYTLSFEFDTEWNVPDPKIARFVFGSWTADVEIRDGMVQVPMIPAAFTNVLVGVYAGEFATTTPAVIRVAPSIRASELKPEDAAEAARVRAEAERRNNELDRMANEDQRKKNEIGRIALAEETAQAKNAATNAAHDANTAAEAATNAAQNAITATEAANLGAQRAAEAVEGAAAAINAATAAAQVANENAIAAATAADNANAKAVSASQAAADANAASANAAQSANNADNAAIRANAAAAATETIGSLVISSPYNELSFSQGSINTTTGTTNSTAKGAVRTGAITLNEFGFSVAMSDVYTVSVFYYQDSEYLCYDEPAQITEIKGGRGNIIRLVVRLTDGGNLSPSDISDISLSVRAVTDTSLTIPSKSADAYATGARFGSLEDNIFAVIPALTTWSQGGIDGTGQATTTNNTRIRSAFIDGTNAEYDITASSGYKFWLWYYNSRDLRTAVSKTDTVTTVRTQRGYWFVAIALKDSGSVIRPAEAINIVINQRVARTLRDWNGLRVSMLGDSISSFNGYAPSENYTYYPTNDSSVSPVQMWWWVALNELGALPLIMDGWSGSCVTEGVRLDRRAMSDPRRCQQLHAYIRGTADDYDLLVTEENIGTLRTSPFVEYIPSVGDYAKRIDPHIVLITGGGNDFTYSAPIGNWDGHEDLDPSEVGDLRRAYANMINSIREVYPNALIICFKPWFFVRPPFTTLGKEQVNRNNLGLTYKDYCDAIEEIAELMACPVVNGFTEGFNRYNYYPAFCADNADNPTHPNGLGQRIIGKNIADQLRSVCVGYVDWLKSQKNN